MKYRALVLILFLFVPICQADNTSQKLESEKPFLGVYLSPRMDLEAYGKQYKGQKGLYIPLVLYQSAAENAGILSGDVILKYDNIAFEDVGKSKLLKAFKHYIRDEKKIQEPLILHILRKKQFYKGKSTDEIIPETRYSEESLAETIEKQLPGDTLTVQIHKEVEALTITAILGRKPHMRDKPPPSNADLLPSYENLHTPDTKIIDQLIMENDLSDAHDDLIQRLSDDEWWDDGFRTRFFRYAHRDPKKFPIMAENLVQKITHSVKPKIDASTLCQTAANLMDVTNMTASSIDLHALSSAGLLSEITRWHEQLKNMYDKAFAKLTDSERELLKTQTPEILERFVDHYYLDIDADFQEMKYHRQIAALARKIDYRYLYEASCWFHSLVNLKWLDALDQLQALEPCFDIDPGELGISGDVLMIKQIDTSYLVIGGPGFTRYKKPVSWIIDLGGDDLYLNYAGAATPDIPISIVIDLSGNDQYTATDKWAQAAGFMGFGFLLDLNGDDRYTSRQLSQGCAVMGVGHLIDLCGNDQYHGQEFHQGAAFWGFGSLIDIVGNDIYQGALFSQAVGGTYGLGLLIDISGSDHYYATGKYKSSYATDGIFRGSSQGFGIGFRGIASGGIGLLVDLAGEDYFMAGNFSQGGGYFFGMGILKNAGNESDTYIASRYGQGFSAHSAAGILIDEGGNDIYKGLFGAVQSAAWDLGIAALIDHSGNDRYDAPFTFFSQGAAAHNGFSMFFDRDGIDTYQSDPSGIAKNHSNDYHKGSSLGFFIDAGNDPDFYHAAPARNNNQYVRGAYGIFLDH